jgi:putative flippase GtrA
MSRSAAEALRPLLAHEAFGQLVRYAVAGLGVTILCAGVYLLLAVTLHVPPMLANVASHCTGVVVGYQIHSRWSFRAEPGGAWAAFARFACASAVPLTLNALWVWLAVHVVQGPAWLPVPAMIAATPFATFLVNRLWVFAKD